MLNLPITLPLVAALKSPPCIAVVGTVAVSVISVWLIRFSYETKKKVLSRLIGPPNVPPNWLWSYWPRGMAL